MRRDRLLCQRCLDLLGSDPFIKQSSAYAAQLTAEGAAVCTYGSISLGSD